MKTRPGQKSMLEGQVKLEIQNPPLSWPVRIVLSRKVERQISLSET